MRSYCRSVRLTIAAFLFSSVAAPTASAEKEDIDLLFRKALVADPADYASIRKAIVEKGEAAAIFLEERAEKGSAWYERSIASAIRLAIVSSERYQEYQAEFEKLARHRVPPTLFDRTAEYGWRKSPLVEEGTKAVPFLIEKAFTELPCKVADRTVIGWHESRPGQTALVLLQCIGGKDAARAVAAAVMGGTRVYFSRGPWDSNISGSPSPKTVATASALRDSQLVDALIPLLREREARPMAAWALGELKIPRAIPALIATLTTYDFRDSGFSAEALSKIGEAAIPALIEAISSSRRETRSLAGGALSRVGKPAIPALANVLREGPAMSHYHAVRALRFIGDREAVPALIEALGSNSSDVVSEAAMGLGEIGDDAARRPLLKALENPRNWHWSAISGIAGSLAKFKETRAFETLAALCWHDDWLVRSAAIQALPAVGGEKSLAILLKLANHEDTGTRVGAVESLGHLGDPRAIPVLICALTDSETVVGSEAAWALGEIGDRSAIPSLRQAIENGNEDMQRIATEAIAKIEAAAAGKPPE